MCVCVCVCVVLGPMGYYIGGVLCVVFSPRKILYRRSIMSCLLAQWDTISKAYLCCFSWRGTESEEDRAEEYCVLF